MYKKALCTCKVVFLPIQRIAFLTFSLTSPSWYLKKISLKSGRRSLSPILFEGRGGGCTQGRLLLHVVRRTLRIPFFFFFLDWEAFAFDDYFVFLTAFTISFHNVNRYLQAVNSIIVYFFKSCIIAESSSMK